MTECQYYPRRTLISLLNMFFCLERVLTGSATPALTTLCACACMYTCTKFMCVCVGARSALSSRHNDTLPS